MNLFLFSERADSYHLAADHPYALHLAKVLRAGDPERRFAVGVEDGPRGLAHAERDPGGDWVLAMERWEPAPVPGSRFGLALPYVRPAEARRILREGACLGVSAFHWFPGEKSQPGYARAGLWSEGATVVALLREGLRQGYHTRMPRVYHHPDLRTLLGRPGFTPVVLDPYAATAPLAREENLPAGTVLLLGGERGLSGGERELLHAAGAPFRHLGSRILRADTAALAALALAQAAAGDLDDNRGAWLEGHSKSLV